MGSWEPTRDPSAPTGTPWTCTGDPWAPTGDPYAPSREPVRALRRSREATGTCVRRVGGNGSQWAPKGAHGRFAWTSMDRHWVAQAGVEVRLKSIFGFSKTAISVWVSRARPWVSRGRPWAYTCVYWPPWAFIGVRGPPMGAYGSHIGLSWPPMGVDGRLKGSRGVPLASTDSS